MIEKVLEYIKNHEIVDIKKLKKDLNVSNEEWDLILLQLQDLGFIIEKGSSNQCNQCAYSKICSQGCLKSETLFLLLPPKD